MFVRESKDPAKLEYLVLISFISTSFKKPWLSPGANSCQVKQALKHFFYYTALWTRVQNTQVLGDNAI